jgi:hypothetical protein
MGAEASAQLSPALPVAPVDPLPDVIVTRLNVTPVDAFTKTPMLDSPAFAAFAGSAVNAMSSKCAPFVRLSTSSA